METPKEKMPVKGGVSSTLTPLLCLVAIALVVLVFWDTRKQHAELLTAIHSLQEDASGDWLDAERVTKHCNAEGDGMTCTFTNTGDRPIRTCAKGVLSRKDNPSLKLYSATLCTGRLDVAETKNLSAPWMDGFADDICYSPNELGQKILDWSNCKFTTEGVDVNEPKK